jgi:hypothetical protein
MRTEDLFLMVIKDFIKDYDGQFITELSILKYFDDNYDEKYDKHVTHLSQLKGFDDWIEMAVDKYHQLCDKHRETLDLKYLLPENQ